MPGPLDFLENVEVIGMGLQAMLSCIVKDVEKDVIRSPGGHRVPEGGLTV